MKVPFFDLKLQYKTIKKEIEPEFMSLFETCSFIGGDYVKRFEREISEYLNVKHAIGCANGTDALALALRACGIKPGDEVITTAFSFFATAEAIAVVGAKPVFVDIKYNDYCIDADKIETVVTERTKAILPVHIFGAPCDMDKILKIAKKHGLKVIEDDAQAIGSSYKGEKAGSIGDIGCFSFYPTKNLGGCGDGGMITTNNDDLATVALALREHGAGKNGVKAYKILEGINTEVTSTEKVTDLYDPFKYYNYLIGYNSRLDALQAIVLSVKLKHLSEYNARRAEVAKMYLEGLDSEILKPEYDFDNTIPCWHQFVIRSPYKQELCGFLGDRGIGSASFYPVPLHKQVAFNYENCKNPGACLPIAEKTAGETVCLPIFPEITDKQVQYVIDTVNSFYEEKHE